MNKNSPPFFVDDQPVNSFNGIIGTISHVSFQDRTLTVTWPDCSTTTYSWEAAEKDLHFEDEIEILPPSINDLI